MADRTYKTYFANRTEANLKKYFYVVRPLCILRSLVERRTLPPMNLGALLYGSALPGEVRRAIDRLLAQKIRSSELGSAERLRVLDRWIEAELGRGQQHCDAMSVKTSILAEAEACFWQVVDGAASVMLQRDG